MLTFEACFTDHGFDQSRCNDEQRSFLNKYPQIPSRERERESLKQMRWINVRASYWSDIKLNKTGWPGDMESGYRTEPLMRKPILTPLQCGRSRFSCWLTVMLHSPSPTSLHLFQSSREQMAIRSITFILGALVPDKNSRMILMAGANSFSTGAGSLNCLSVFRCAPSFVFFCRRGVRLLIRNALRVLIQL